MRQNYAYTHIYIYIYIHIYIHTQDTILSCTHALEEREEREQALRQELVDAHVKVAETLKEREERDKELTQR